VVLRPQAAVYQVLSNVVNQAAQLTGHLTDVLNTRIIRANQSDNVRRRGVQPPIDIIVNPPILLPGCPSWSLPAVGSSGL